MLSLIWAPAIPALPREKGISHPIPLSLPPPVLLPSASSLLGGPVEAAADWIIVPIPVSSRFASICGLLWSLSVKWNPFEVGLGFVSWRRRRPASVVMQKRKRDRWSERSVPASGVPRMLGVSDFPQGFVSATVKLDLHHNLDLSPSLNMAGLRVHHRQREGSAGNSCQSCSHQHIFVSFT